MKMRKFTVLTLCVFALLIPASFAAAETAEAKDGLDVYFRDAAVLSLSDQKLAEYPKTDAGESDVLARAWDTAPPGISHTVEDMYPIGLGANECLDCHSPENAVEGDIPLSDAHLETPQMGKGKAEMVWIVKGYKKGKEVSNARYDCRMCHAPQAMDIDTPNTTFVTMNADKEKKKK
jgi:cytochrome c-type protein NapB